MGCDHPGCYIGAIFLWASTASIFRKLRDYCGVCGGNQDSQQRREVAGGRLPIPERIHGRLVQPLERREQVSGEQ